FTRSSIALAMGSVYGVPHIVAENEKALAFAVGYEHAKDRLFQMDLHRRMMKCQLSELFGLE
ncbi:penicillin acylase family protein, partial [Serratia marcescens]|uniref:penicillin acylase family protein n=1 Tax=Serratia marcescens TaxID=615 RepID=UPI001952DA8C